MFNLKLQFVKDELITFEEKEHVYTYEPNKKRFTSCTTFIKQFFPSFNAKRVGATSIHSKKYKKQLEEYATDEAKLEALLKIWEANGLEARTLGTNLHANIEHYLNEELDPSQDTSVEFQQFLKFHQKMIDCKYIPLRSEAIVYDTKHEICGTIDQLYLKDGYVHIVDWKRTKGITQFSFDKSTAYMPLVHLKNTNFYHYSLQLNLYKYILEHNYNLKVCSMRLVAFYPTKESYEEVFVNDLQREIRWILEAHKMDQTDDKEDGLEGIEGELP